MVNSELTLSGGAFSNLRNTSYLLSSVGGLTTEVLKFSSVISLASGGGKCPVIKIDRLFVRGDNHSVKGNARLYQVNTTSIGCEHAASS